MNVYEIITERITKQLENHNIPWRRTWSSAGFPRNYLSNKEYRGINLWLLHCNAFSSPYWLTWKQLKRLGGHVRQGESASPVVFWKPWQVKETKGGETKVKDVPILRYYTVYNADQILGIDFPCLAEKEFPFTPLEAGEKVLSEMPDKPVMREGNNACYIPSKDAVYLPRKERFELPQHFYSTAFHELVHSTGSEDRLKRKGIEQVHGFGTHEYSKEELVAEFGASYLCGHCGIEINETFNNSVAYIKGWISKLKNNPRWLIFAASQAQKAADYILNTKRQEKKSSVLHLILS